MSIFSFLAGVVQIVLLLLRGRHDDAQQKIGAMKQKAATLEAREGQASDANAIDEAVARLSDDDLDRELRGKPKSGS